MLFRSTARGADTGHNHAGLHCPPQVLMGAGANDNLDGSIREPLPKGTVTTSLSTSSPARSMNGPEPPQPPQKQKMLQKPTDDNAASAPPHQDRPLTDKLPHSRPKATLGGQTMPSIETTHQQCPYAQLASQDEYAPPSHHIRPERPQTLRASKLDQQPH